MMNKLCIVAVDIRSTHNIGSILRSADGFSADVILCGISPRPKNLSNENRLPHVVEKTHAAIAKTALGAENSTNISYFESAEKAIEFLKTEGYLVAAIEQSTNSRPITGLKTQANTAILVGPEVSGLDDNILKNCDEVYEIPMLGKKESFNVAVASGIALYQARLNDIKTW
jgi:23S rRNA (guanosine2251-2'-O)-methyltransferase